MSRVVLKTQLFRISLSCINFKNKKTKIYFNIKTKVFLMLSFCKEKGLSEMIFQKAPLKLTLNLYKDSDLV